MGVNRPGIDRGSTEPGAVQWSSTPSAARCANWPRRGRHQTIARIVVSESHTVKQEPPAVPPTTRGQVTAISGAGEGE
jgi:hypothetical protein